MLRITYSDRENTPVFVLEGRLGAEWVDELLHVTRRFLPGTKLIFDIEDVLFVDQLGEKALQWLNAKGATFVAQNPYGVDLCKRLQLRHCGREQTPFKSGQRRRGAEPQTPGSSESQDKDGNRD